MPRYRSVRQSPPAVPEASGKRPWTCSAHFRRPGSRPKKSHVCSKEGPGFDSYVPASTAMQQVMISHTKSIYIYYMYSSFFKAESMSVPLVACTVY